MFRIPIYRVAPVRDGSRSVPLEVFETALLQNAAGMIVAHSHPTGRHHRESNPPEFAG